MIDQRIERELPRNNIKRNPINFGTTELDIIQYEREFCKPWLGEA